MLLILVGVISAAMSHIALKHAAPAVSYHGSVCDFLRVLFSNGWFVLGAGLHFLSLFLWLFGLRRTDLSLAHPMIALSLVFMVLYSRIWLNEALDWHRVMGMLLVIGGIVTMARS
jgi:drug/metabolite transporter (DMT)-like permease